MMFFRDEQRNAIIIAALFAAFVLAALSLHGCGSEARPPAPDPGPAAVIGSLGATLAWAGGISAAAGLGLSLIALFYPPLQPFAVIFRLVGIGGAGVSFAGASYIWIAQHYWWVLVAAGLAGIGIAWWFWPKLHRLLDRRLQADAQ